MNPYYALEAQGPHDMFSFLGRIREGRYYFAVPLSGDRRDRR